MNIDMLSLVAAFGGGSMGGYLGGVPCFILTGIFAIVGSCINMAGGDGSFIIGQLAFGSFFGPHVAFLGGVAAAAYAGRKGLMAGASIGESPVKTGAPDVVLVGGVFGVIGFLVISLVNMTPLGDATQMNGALITDGPGITIFIVSVVIRLAFGSTGLTGKYTGTAPRVWFSSGKAFGMNVMMGLGVGTVVSFVAGALLKATAGTPTQAMIIGNFHLTCFGLSAFSLIFLLIGNGNPGIHHFALPGAYAAMIGFQAWGEWGVIFGVVVAIVCSLFGDLVGNSINSHCDTHIDPPAVVIFISMIILNLIKVAVVPV